MRSIRSCILFLALAVALAAAELPGQYFHYMESGAAEVEARLNSIANPDLASLETQPGWKHFGYSVLAPAVLYTKKDAANHHYHDPKMLKLAERIGDLLASEQERGKFEPRLDSDWDTYTWLEAYRILKDSLGAERRARWQKAILENVAPFEPQAAERVDFPWYNSPYIGTSPNHYSQWGELLYLAGRVFDKPDWVKTGTQILHRFATVEQTADGYWGEHSRNGPTIGYDHLTLSAVAVYWEHSHDPAVLEALRRSKDFHMYFTYPDGTPAETMNDRNRYGGPWAWAQFAFTNFPDGRRYAAFLAGFFEPGHVTMDSLGRIAQDALYYHPGPTAPIPQDADHYMRQMSIPAAIRKTGPWVVSLSGIVDTPAPTNQFYIDRQAEMSVFHSKLGLIVCGANSKRQPELATFREKVGGVEYQMPLSSRLQMGATRDRLSFAFNNFFSDLYVDAPTANEVKFHFAITGKGSPPQEAFNTLQLVLHPGEPLETAGGKSVVLGSERIELGSEEIGGWIRHHGWTIYVDPTARLVWPVYPYNPYSNSPENTLTHAVAALSVPLNIPSQKGHSVRPDEQEIAFRIVTQ